jgi:hypothetical protein
MNFQNDICLILPASQEKLDTELSGWIDQFRNNLNTILKRQIGRDLRFTFFVPGDKININLITESAISFLFMDGTFKKIQGFNKLLEELTERLEIKKETTLQEEKIVKIALSESGMALASGYLKYFTSVEFFGKKVSALLDGTTIPYWSKLLDLSSLFLRMTGEESGSGRDGAEGQDVVFLANTTPDQESNRDTLRRELSQYGYRVEPEIDVHLIAGESKTYLLSILEKAKIAVHLFGNEYGELFTGNGVSLPEYQMNIVTGYIDKLEHEKAAETGNLIRLIWLSPEISPLDEKQIAFLSQIKQNIERFRRTEIIQAPLELFKSILLKRLKQISHDEKKASARVKADRKTIYVIHDKRDEKEAFDLVNKFLKTGMNAIKIDFETGGMNLINIHKENLVHCDAALIIYGHTNRFWLSSKMKDLMKAPGFGREHPLTAKGLMIRGEDKLAGMQLPGDMMVIDQQDALGTFIEKLK